jgi:hypothetical protein
VQKVFTSKALTIQQVFGLIFWIGALLPIVLGKPVIFLALILYLTFCAIEVVTLKYFIIPKDFMFHMSQTKPYYSRYADFVFPCDEELDQRCSTFSKPIDMDNKANKITY